MSEACYKWVNVKCMQGSSASSWGVGTTDLKSDAEFIHQAVNQASQMEAQGLGFALFVVSIISGTLHDRFRETLMRYLTTDETWTAMTCWSRWVGKNPAQLPIEDRRKAVEDVRRWTEVWMDFASSSRAALMDLESETSQDISNAIAKYAGLMKRKRITSVDGDLLEETELFAKLLAGGIPMPWTQRRSTRNHILEVFYGSLIISFLPALEGVKDIASWNQEFKGIRHSLNKFASEETPRTQSGKAEGSRNHNRPNRLDERRSREGKPKERQPNESDEKSKSTSETKELDTKQGYTQGCFGCGGPHLIKDCPKKSQNEQRHSPRLAGKKKQQEFTAKRSGLLGTVGDNSEDDSGSDLQSECDSDFSDRPPTFGPADEKLGLFAGDLKSQVRTVAVECNGKKLKFGLDGGLDISLILRKHVVENPKQSMNVRLEGLGGHLHIHESAACIFKFGERNLGIVSQLPGGFDGLFGIDLIDQLDLPSIIKFRKALRTVQEELTGGSLEGHQNINDDGTWTPMFTYSAGPLSEEDLRSFVAALKLPMLSCSFDSVYPLVREMGRPTPFKWRDMADEMIEQFIKDGVMREAAPEKLCWVSPGIFIPKASDNGELKLRFVIDYKTVNKRVIKPHIGTYPHNTPKFLSQIRRSATFFSKVDIKNAFFNLPLAESVRPFLHTSIITTGGERIFEMLKGPQGFSETPIWWISFIEEVLRGLNKVLNQQIPGDSFGVIAFVDDILTFGNSEKICVFVHEALLQVLCCLGIPFGKVCKPAEEVEIIGLEISRKGVRMAKVDSFDALSEPKDRSELRTALGVFQYIRNGYNVKDFVHHIAVLSKLLKKNENFEWTEEIQASWDWLKRGFDNSYYHFFSSHDRIENDECFIIQTDASEKGISSVLWISDTKPRGVELSEEWFSVHCKLLATKCRVFTKEESSYPVWDKEALSIFESLQAYSDMMLCAIGDNDRLFVYSDSKAAVERWSKVMAGEPLDLNCSSGPRSRRWTRWVDDLELLFLLDPQFQHIPGEKNQVADYFSRALKQIKEGPTLLGMSGAILTPEHRPERLPGLNSELLERIKALTVSQENDDKYQGKFLREIIDEEDCESSFRMTDGLLYFCATGSMPRLYVPKGKALLNDQWVDIRVALISLAHQAHEGIKRTTNNLKGYYWPKQSQLIAAFIKSCVHCQKKNIETNFGRITGRAVPERFARIVIDHATPSQIGLNDYGQPFRHVLIICDSFSRFIQLVPVHSMETAETIEALLQWCLTFGFPRELVSDNAINLRSLLIDKALSITSREVPDIKRWIAPVGYPQSQGEAERVVREMKQYLSVRDSTSWPKQLPFLSFAHNSGAYGASGLSPFSVVTGDEPTNLIDLTRFPVIEDLPPTMEEYMTKLKDKLATFHEYHSLKLDEYRAISRDYYNSHHETVNYQVGDQVWIVRKYAFKTQVQGPMKVIRLRGDHLYDVESEDGEITVPMQHLAPYIEPSLVDREGIPFTDYEPEERLNLLRHKDPSQLNSGDLVLIQRGRQTNDVFEYDIASVVENFPPTGMFRCDLMTVNAGDQWAPTGLIFTFPYSSIIASGFKLTRRGQLRRVTRREWSAIGIL